MQRVQLGGLTLQPRRQLLAGDERLSIGRRTLEILSVLAEADGEIVTKGEILEAVWPGIIVEENAIQVHIAALRKALGEEAGRLVTVRGVGYRLSIDAEPAPETGEAPSSVAVLPFANLTGDPRMAYLCEAIVRELIELLSRRSHLKVSSWQATHLFDGQAFDIRVVAGHLGVETVVEGWIRCDADTVRVGAELIDPTTGFHIWSGHFDKSLSEVLRLDSDLASSIATALLRHMRRSGRVTRSAGPVEEKSPGRVPDA